MARDVEQNKAPYEIHPFIKYIFKICSTVLSVVGLMQLTSFKIEWSEDADKVIIYYQQILSEPIHEFFQSIARKINLNIDWIPSWFYDYIPIASIFSFALLFSYLRSENTTLWQLITDSFSNFKKALKEQDIGEIFIEVIITILTLITIFLISPVFGVVFPVLIAGLIALSITLIIFIYFNVLKLFTLYILPAIIILYLITIIILYLKFKEKYNGFVNWHKNTGCQLYYNLNAFLKKKLKEIKSYFKEKAYKKDVSSAKEGIWNYIQLIKNQYINASVILTAFLIILFLDYNNRGFDLKKTINHIWHLLQE